MGRVSRGPHLEGLVRAEHWCNLVPTVGAPHPAELAYQPLTRLAVVSYLFLVVWAHQALETQMTIKYQPMECIRVLTYHYSSWVPSLR
jgi:hypothetical protein